MTAWGNTSAVSTVSGHVAHWGYHGTSGPLIPVFDRVISGVRQFATNGDTHCAVGFDDSLRCWGENSREEVGDGTRTDRSAPYLHVGLTVRQVVIGGHTTCALLTDGTVRCWGTNPHGIHGVTDFGSSVPRPVPGLSSIVQITMGGNYFMCARRASGAVACWGNNPNGQLGDGTRTERYTPADVPGIMNAVDITAGGGHACAVLADGTVWCWGGNDHLQINCRRYEDQLVPALVQRYAGSVPVIRNVAAGNSHTCAIDAEGDVYCWGGNSFGQLGLGLRGDDCFIRNPVRLGMQDVMAIASGYRHTCAALASGDVSCWGGNANGQLGDGSRTDALIPVSVGW